MVAIPNGTNPWARAMDHASYGGNVEKHDLFNSGAIDALTDVAAVNMTRLAQNLASCGLVAPFMTLYVRSNDPVTEPPLVKWAYSMNGNVPGGYVGDNPPTGFPEVTRTTDTNYLIEFPLTYTDPYGVSSDWIPKVVQASTMAISNATVGVEMSIGGDSSAVRMRTTTTSPDHVLASFNLQVW